MGAGAGFGVSPLSIAFSVFIMLLDVLVSFIQAYVFTLLSSLYIGMATAEHH
jgi:F-type H+-transporting ATPase subunit a